MKQEDKRNPYLVRHEMFFDRYFSNVYEFRCPTLANAIKYFNEHVDERVGVFYQNKVGKWETICTTKRWVG